MSPPVQALVASYGYTGSASTIYRRTSSGWSLAVHFDDRLTIASDGRGQFALHVLAEIGAPDAADGKAVHFTLHKTALRQAAHEWIWLSLEIDVIVPNGMAVHDLRARPPFLGRLQTLMEDVLVTLDGLPEHNVASSPGPRLRVEARLLGDLFVSRNGFVSGKGAETDGRYRAACRCACTWLAYILLPEFAAILRLENLATPSASTGRERGLAALPNSDDLGRRNNTVATRAQMNAGAPAKNTGGQTPKLPRPPGGEPIPQDDTPLPQSKSMKRKETKPAPGNRKPEVSESRATAADTGEILAANTPQAAEIAAIKGAATPRRKSTRLAARPRALLHT
jgi:hypothetical protein